MGDIALDKIHDLLHDRITSKTLGQLGQDEIELAIRLIENTDNPDLKTKYSLKLAFHLAVTGGLNDLTAAVKLVEQANSDPYNRHHTITELCARYMAIENKSQALQLAGLMESDASILEEDRSFFPAQKAFVWTEVAKLYSKIGVLEKTSMARDRAIRLAVGGQSIENDPQEVSECVAILGNIIIDLIAQDKYVTALEVAHMWEWKHRDNWIEALELLAKTKPG